MLGAINDIGFYRELMRRGIAEYLAVPTTARDLLAAVTGSLIDPDAPPAARSIAFMASRGGAGASTVAHNVAWQLSQTFEEEVALVDMDITYGTAALAFNVEPTQTIDQVLADTGRLDDVLLERFLLEVDDNLRLLAAPASVQAEEHNLTGPLDPLLELLRRRSAFVVLDIPHRWAPWVKQLLTDVDEIVITGVLDLAGLRDTRNLVEYLREQRGPEAPVRVALNHEGAYRKSELSPKDFEGALGTAPDLVLAHDAGLFGQAANNGQMIAQANARSRAAEGLRDLAITVSGRQPAEARRKGLALNVEFLNRFKRSA